MRITKNQEKTFSKNQYKDYLKSKPVKFIENKGQIVDVNFRSAVSNFRDASNYFSDIVCREKDDHKINPLYFEKSS